MKEHELTLKERLKELISDSKVQAAVFYTFNFDPKFFENYVMPLLLPSKQFSNNPVVNNVIWRAIYKDSAIPPITIYYDQYAKSTENGPMLPYDVIAVSMQAVGKNKGNFHPKLSFILLETARGEQQLITLAGSNNLTQGGWCENRESVSEHILVNNRNLPESLVKQLQQFMYNTSAAYGRREWTEAEQVIHQFLRQRGWTREKDLVFYDSFQSSFDSFLDEHVFESDEIQLVEILSPFFLNDDAIVRYFLSKKVTLRVQAPFRGDYCMMKPEVYHTYKNPGV